MATYHEFYPNGRVAQLNLNQRWMAVFMEDADDGGSGSSGKKKWQAWGLSIETFNAYSSALSAAESALNAVVLSGLRQGPLHTAVGKAFDTLEKLARDIRRRYFFSPPLTDEDLEKLGEKPRDTTRTPSPIPRYAPEVTASNPAKHTIRLNLAPPKNADQDLSAFKMLIRIGILPRDGKIPEKTSFASWYISKVPTIAEELPKVLDRKRKTEDITLSALETGSTAYISACYINSRGEPGPWSDIIEVIIT